MALNDSSARYLIFLRSAVSHIHMHFISFVIFVHIFIFFSLPRSRNSDAGSYSRLFPPSPDTVRALHFSRGKISALSSLVDSRQIVPSHARRSQQLILFLFLANKFKISPPRDSKSRTNATIILMEAFGGYHYGRPSGRPAYAWLWQ